MVRLGHGYRKGEVEAVAAATRTRAAAYFATAKDPAPIPYHWYKAFVIAGAAEHALPLDYIKRALMPRSRCQSPHEKRKLADPCDGARLASCSLPSEVRRRRGNRRLFPASAVFAHPPGTSNSRTAGSGSVHAHLARIGRPRVSTEPTLHHAPFLHPSVMRPPQGSLAIDTVIFGRNTARWFGKQRSRPGPERVMRCCYGLLARMRSRLHHTN